MRKLFSASPLALCVLGALALFGCSANGSSGLTADLPVSPAPAPQTLHANGLVEDWSTSHVIYPRVGNINAMMALQSDVRAMQSWKLVARNALLQSRVPPRFLPLQTDAHPDWSISLGTGSVGVGMYPAKFSFDTSTTALTAANCTSDFAVFPVDVAGSATQPNIVAFDNLYSGTVPVNGLCNRASPPLGDNGTSATTMWSYNIHAAGGIVATAPALSLDGTKVAFVESGGGAAHLHVLAGKTGDGVDIATPNAQNVLKPVSITTGFSATSPAANSGAVTDLSFGAANDTLSSPFVDYANDFAYVGNDAGVLFRFKNVFCTTTACTSGGSPAPTLDTSWPTASPTGSISVCAGVLSGAVVDGSNGNIFVGCSDGKLYGFNSAGAALATASVTVGDGSAKGGVVDPPLVDAGHQFVYAVAGANGGGTNAEVVVQAKSTDLSGAVTATLGAGGIQNMHAPAVNNAYLSGGPAGAGALLYEWGLNAGDTAIELYGLGFNGSGVMLAAPANTLVGTGSTPVELSPVTEFNNGANDQLFVSGLTPTVTTNFIEYNINTFPSTFLPTGAAGATRTEGNGTSGIIVDNASSSAQASSVYFGVLGAGNFAAVKLTQNALN